MKFKLVTLAGEKINQEAYAVIIPTIDGEISIFPDHEPLVTVAKEGIVTVQFEKGHGEDKREYFAISGGIVEVNGRLVKILVDEADHGEDILEAETQIALERAIAMRDNAASDVELDKARQLIDRHAVRLKVADLQRRKRRM